MKRMIIQSCFFILLLTSGTGFAETGLSLDVLNGTNLVNSLIFKGSSTVMGKTLIRNTGSVTFDLGLTLTGSAGLIPVTSTPSSEEVRIFGLFHAPSFNPLFSDFDDNDLILPVMRMAATNGFAMAGELKNYKAYNVVSGGERTLSFRIDTPSFTAKTNQALSLRILITAVPSPPEKESKPSQSFFTPNGDGVNDVLRFPGLAGDFMVKILDSAGRIVKLIRDKNEWDGTDTSGLPVRGGMYMYQYSFEGRFRCGLVVLAR
jgi:gliding motility-associated-like protein